MESLRILYAQASRWAFPVLLIVLIAAVLTCNNEQSDKERYKNSIATNEERTRQVENQNGQLVAINQSILAKTSEDIQTLTDTLFNLKERENKLIASVNGYTKILQGIDFKNKEAVYIDRPGTKETIYLPQPEDTALIRVPRDFAYQDSTISIAGTVRRNRVTLDSIAIPNTVHIRTVEIKSGFLNLGRRDEVQVINSNPAITSKVSNVILKRKPNAWNRWIKPAVAFGAGVFVASKIRQ